MPPALEKLEQRIRDLFGRIDRLRGENESFRRVAVGRGDEVTSQQALEQIELLKRENGKLHKKLAKVDKRLDKLLEELDKPRGQG